MSQQQPQVVITAARNGSGKFMSWSKMSVDGTDCQTPLPQCVIQVGQGNTAIVTVTISDPSKPSGDPPITFSNDPVTAPPTQPPEIVVQNGQGTSSVSFLDKNVNQGTVKYSLNFNGVPSIDPIMQNGGGGSPPSALGFIPLPTTTQQFTIDLLIAFVIGAIVAVLARRLFSR